MMEKFCKWRMLLLTKSNITSQYVTVRISPTVRLTLLVKHLMRIALTGH